MAERKRAHLMATSPVSTPLDTRYVFVTGGVVSGLGKGITISSIGRLLKASGVSVTSIKIDPYLNVDAGLLAPGEHGETFVLNDGGETDLDLGNYERFLDVTLTKDHNITTGKIYKEIIERERRGDYLGATCQVIPHCTDLIQEWIAKVGRIPVDGTDGTPDVVCCELGGTCGDLESMVFYEAIRQFMSRVGRERCCLVHVSLVPVLGAVGEQKTKPTQHSIRQLMSLGLSPDIIVCRSTNALEESTKKKISQFCQVAPSCVLSVHDVSNIYHVPLILQEQGLSSILRESLGLQDRMSEVPELAAWRKLAKTVDEANEEVVIALVGKYTSLHDSYLSVLKALKHSCIEERRALTVSWIESSDLERETKENDIAKFDEAWRKLKGADGILIPGGFGDRGLEGKLAAARYAREHCVPCLGVCLGLQVMVIEFARTILGWNNATSEEIDENAKRPLIIKMLEHHPGQMGGTMRLGARKTILHPLPKEDNQEKSIASVIHSGAKEVMERHRHRYEVNPKYISNLEKAGLRFTGKDQQNERMETVELPRNTHPFYFGVQFHPELKSRPGRPSPSFHAFVRASMGTFAEAYEVPESTAVAKTANGTVPTPRNKRQNSMSDFGETSGAPGVGQVKRPRVISDA